MKIGENAKRGPGERRQAYKRQEQGYCRSQEGTAGTGEALAAVGGRNGVRTGSRGKNERKKAPCLHTVQEDME